MNYYDARETRDPAERERDLLARLGAGFGRRGGLRFEREVDVLRLQYLIGLLQERQYTAETEICNRLVDDFLYFYRCHSKIQDCR